MKERFTYDSNKIRTLLDGIYLGEITEYSIPEDLYFSIVSYLRSGLYQGFGGDLTQFKGKDLELLEDLRTNVYHFSGGKSYSQIKEYRSLLLDENGELRKQSEFTKLGEQAFETWNENWGLSERSNCVHNAMIANKWSEIERNKDLLPILVFDTTGNGCPICAPYEGYSADANDPIWGWLSPTLHFNCECLIRQEESDYPLSSKEETEKVEGLKETVPEAFQMNPYFDREIFSQSHPYFDTPKNDIDFKNNNYGLPLPESD